jgi:hypothetical protein
LRVSDVTVFDEKPIQKMDNTLRLSVLALVGWCAADDPCAGGACGEHLNVSPLIAAGEINEARKKLKVTGLSEIENMI